MDKSPFIMFVTTPTGEKRGEANAETESQPVRPILGVRNDSGSDPESKLPLISGLPINQQVKGQRNGGKGSLA